ncbi:MAG: hypothetical protein NTY38_15750 [Acidobacteria bacterium]|nr:hypothetical protein [Acidobacteriota bacterium]
MENEALSFSFSPGGGRQVRNRLADEAVELPPEEFALELEPGGVVRSTAFQCRVTKAGRERMEIEYSGAAGLEVRVVYTLAGGKAYLRKQLSVRRVGGEGTVRLLRVELENWRGVRRRWRSMKADKVPYGSHPIYCQTWWAGVEFVAAFNTYDAEGFVLASRPGAVPLEATWRALRPTLTGAVRPGRAREAFLAYMEDIRRSPARLVTCYNSWWTMPKVVKQQDNLALIGELKAKLFERHGVFFDIITTDMGWSDPRSIWQINRAVLPRGFDDIRPIVEGAGGKLGLWMSPSEIYPPVCDYAWAEKNGYTVVRTNPRLPGLSLADPRYREQTKAQLKKLIREEGLKHIKYDGFLAEEDKPHDGLRAGVDSVEPLAGYSLELLEASKEADPELVTEPTYLNSHLYYLSPWMLQYSDSLWANAGGDYPPGLTPAPHYREAQTSAREYFIFRSLDEVWLPQNAVQHFDIVHVDEREGFANHAAMAFARGRFFVPAYINPRLMAEDDWRVLAGLIRWAKANKELLRHTVELPSRVEAGEPYAYAHWQGTRGMIAVRNPSNHNREYVLELGRTQAPAGLRDAVCYAQYPHRRGIAEKLDAGSTVRLRLAPWELLYLEVVPRAELREPVALGARWYREADGAMAVVAENETRVLLPGGGERVVAGIAQPGEPLRGEMTAQCLRRLPEEQWLSACERRPPVALFRYPIDPDSEAMRALKKQDAEVWVKQKVESMEFETACRVQVPAGVANAQVLLLVQFPGRKFRESTCTGELDGRALKLTRRDTSQHAGYFVANPNNAWKDVAQLESQWCWYIGEVPAGTHQVRFRGAVGHESPRLGVWLWAERELRPVPAGGALQCPEAALPQVRERWEREGLCLKSPVV